MIQQLRIHLWALALVASVGCTDGRLPALAPFQGLPGQAAPQTLVFRSSIQYNGQPTDAYQMMVSGDSLYVTGQKWFGFMEMNVGTTTAGGGDPESPTLLFSVGEHVDRFPAWIVDKVAAGALTVINNYAIMSGSAGTSMIDTSLGEDSQEVWRYPGRDANGMPTLEDPKFEFKALTNHPSAPMAYGFTKTAGAYRLYQTTAYMQGVGNVPVLYNLDYNTGPLGQTTCCVTGAATYNNQIFVAYSTRLVTYALGAQDGKLASPTTYGDVQATNVQATAQYVYVQHQASFSQSAGLAHASGIYVMKGTGSQLQVVAFLPKTPKRFAVSSDDQYIYMDEDGQAINVYKIQWTTGL